MRSTTEKIERYRDKRHSSSADGHNGLFFIPGYKPKETLKVICSDGGGWDHVSVSLKTRCPTWPEMCMVKDLFFDPNETVVQFHPSIEEYVNNHPFCLHLWRSQTDRHELPPSWMTGIKGLEMAVDQSSGSGDT